MSDQQPTTPKNTMPGDGPLRASFVRSRSTWLVLVLLLLMTLIGATVLGTIVGTVTPGRDEVYDRIVGRGVLRVGMDASFPPFEFLDEQRMLQGFDVDISKELAQRMQLRAEFVTTGFDSLYPELAADHFDVIISGLPFDRAKTRDVAYSDIYFRGGEVLLVRADQTNVKAPADLNGKTVGVEFGTAAETVAKALERRNGYRVRSFNSLAEAAHALEENAVQAVVADAVSAHLLRRTYPQLLIAGEPIGDEPNYVIALPITAPQLLAAVNKHLRAMQKDGLIKQFVEKWF